MSEGHPLFSIDHYTKDDDSYMYSDTRYYWDIRSSEFGDEFCSFSGYSNQSSAGTQEGGADRVAFSEDGSAVVATNYDGTEDRKALPVALKLANRGAQLKLTFADGRTELRDRRAPCRTTKYGQPIFGKLKGAPKDKA